MRKELDRTQVTVRKTMDKLRDGKLAQFVSLGGWVRGTEAASSAILAEYSHDRADVLHQPGLVAHFRKILATLDGPSADLAVVKRMKADLPAMEKLMAAPALDREAVAAIHDQCARIVADLAGPPPEGGQP